VNAAKECVGYRLESQLTLTEVGTLRAALFGPNITQFYISRWSFSMIVEVEVGPCRSVVRSRGQGDRRYPRDLGLAEPFHCFADSILKILCHGDALWSFLGVSLVVLVVSMMRVKACLLYCPCKSDMVAEVGRLTG